MIDKLMLFGLTRQEATIYICLYQSGSLTGYEVAKQTGISRSNVYSTLSGLVEKGAAYRMEGSANKYVAIPIDELCENRLRMITEAREYLLMNINPVKEDTDGYITIEGYRNIQDKIFNMIKKAEKRVYLSITYIYLEKFDELITGLVNRNIKVVILTDQKLEQRDGVQIYFTDHKDKQIHLIVDSKLVLTGDYSQQDSDTCLYSGQKNFVNVLKEALRNEIRLINISENKDN